LYQKEYNKNVRIIWAKNKGIQNTRYASKSVQWSTKQQKHQYVSKSVQWSTTQKNKSVSKSVQWSIQIILNLKWFFFIYFRFLFFGSLLFNLMQKNLNRLWKKCYPFNTDTDTT